MQLQQRINAFVALGNFIKQFSSEKPSKHSTVLQNEVFFETMFDKIKLAKTHNHWFTQDNIQFCFASWSEALSEKNLQQWTANYNLQGARNKTIAIVMAGNIPLVGFHDFLSVLISGNSVLAKPSSNDKTLLPFLAEYLIAVEPSFKNKITFTEEKLKKFDAVIATGSNNTARYFDYYFGKYPNIIRKNRNSVAVLSGDETKEELTALAGDIFRYFGLGCRNVSKIYIPESYNFDTFFNAMFTWKSVINNFKYMNNYDYNKAVYLMSNIKLLDNEFMLLKEDEGFSSPISVVFYERYTSEKDLNEKLTIHKDEIQCIVSAKDVPFGEAQNPKLWEYADGVDTLQFLTNLS